MPYYRREDVERSRDVLRELLTHAPGATLIGGWGTWARLHGEMSHDIYLIIDHTELATLQSLMDAGIDKNQRLGNKRTADYQGVHVDLYVTHEAVIGQRLQIAAESFSGYTDEVDRFRVLTPEAHIVTKTAGLLDRPDTMKGQKDRYEIISLYRQGADPSAVRTIACASSQTNNPNALIDESFDLLAEYEPLREQGTWGKKDKRWLNDLLKWSREAKSTGT